VHQGIVGKVAIESEGDFTQQKVTDRIDAVLVDQHVRFDDVGQAFTHFLALYSPPAMGKHLFRQRDAGCHQESRPVDGVKAQDVLADNVNVTRPEFAELTILVRIAEGADVVGQGVEPDIDDMFLVARNRDSPGEGRS
jgi:hypothetical protein